MVVFILLNIFNIIDLYNSLSLETDHHNFKPIKTNISVPVVLTIKTIFNAPLTLEV